MTEAEALDRMVPPGRKRPNKEQMLSGVMQIMITRACDRACYHCTQGSNFGGRPAMMTVDQFERACLSLFPPGGRHYFGVVGVFGGNPAVHPQFEQICEVMRKHVPYDQRGLWCNHPRGKGRVMAETFHPLRCNLNVHQDREAWDEFRRDWPGSRPFGLNEDARHAPVFAAMRDLDSLPGPGGAAVPNTEENRLRIIADCDINKHWSALIGVFRGDLRAFFCEIAYAQSALHEADPEYPDTGLMVVPGWWERPMTDFAAQVRKHCHECGVPLHGYGELANAPDGTEVVTRTHARAARPKVVGRKVAVIDSLVQLSTGRLTNLVDYMGNGRQ